MNGEGAESTFEPLADSRIVRFDAVFERHWTTVCGVLYRLVGDQAEAEDIALEVFWRLYQGMVRSPQTEFGVAWLYKVATNLGLNALRSRKRRRGYEYSAGRESVNAMRDRDPFEQARCAEEQRLVRTVLARLRRRSSRLLLLRYSGFSYAELARVLELPVGSIGSLLARAEKEFLREFEFLKAGGRGGLWGRRGRQWQP